MKLTNYIASLHWSRYLTLKKDCRSFATFKHVHVPFYNHQNSLVRSLSQQKHYWTETLHHIRARYLNLKTVHKAGFCSFQKFWLIFKTLYVYTGKMSDINLNLIHIKIFELSGYSLSSILWYYVQKKTWEKKSIVQQSCSFNEKFNSAVSA